MPNTNNYFTSPLMLSTLDGMIGVTFNGIAANDWSGWSVASAGDVNGDGIDDILIGTVDASLGNTNGAGSTYLIFGHIGTWGTPLELSTLNGTNGVVINGVAAKDQSGYSVASAGDVNGDGIDDILIGAPYFFNVTSAGSTYLIFGRTGVWSSPFALLSLDGMNGVVINGVAAKEQSGSSVASAGDVNGDGIDDILIGAPGASPGNTNGAGSTYLIFGRTGIWDSPFALSSLNGTNGVVINGAGISDYHDLSGSSVASAGDVNGDGIEDVLIAAPNAGCTYLIFGHSGAWSSPLALSSLNGNNGVVILGGSNSVASAGDVNGDDLDDMLIGGLPSYLVFGHKNAWNTPLDLQSLNGTNGVAIYGAGSFSGVGLIASGGGDVNGDSISDILIGGSPSHLILGHKGAWNTPLDLQNLNGANAVVILGGGNSVALAGDVNGDGLNDMLIGNYQASPKYLNNAGSTYLIFGDSLDLLTNTLTVNQGETIFLNNSILAAYHPHNLAINSSIPFRITNVVHGAFSTHNFLQSALLEQSVSFTHDNSIYAPSFEITVGNWAIAGPLMATISFAVSPVLYINPFSVNQGQTVVLTTQTIRATSLYYPSDALMFSVSNVLHGSFVKTNTTIIENQFNQSVLAQGQIAFATDGSAIAPSYDISVSNGRVTTSAIHGTINFNAAPTLLNNQLTLTIGQQKVILSRNDLSATGTAIPLGELIFVPSTLNCHFENLNLPGTELLSFLQGNIQGSQILFVWDGYTMPAYNMSVSDGILWAEPQAALVRLNTLPATPNTSIQNSNTIENAIIGSTISGIIGLGFFAFKYFLNKRMNDKLRNMLKVEDSEVEKEQEAWKRETLLPVAREVFNHLKTTGLCGYRDEAATKEYVQSIELLLTELEKQEIEIDLTKLSVTEQRRLLNAIVKEIQTQLVKPSSCCSKGWFMSFTRPAFKAAELNSAASAIAKVVAITLKQGAEVEKIRQLPSGNRFSGSVTEDYIELRDAEEHKLLHVDGKNKKTSSKTGGKN